MPAYQELAGLYDLLMDDVDYDAWAEYYLELIRRAGVEPSTLCDCACGTGSMSVRFAERGLRVTGTDISEAMLERAQAKAREHGVKVVFARQDMCSLRLPRPVDALVCACDGVNYLTDDERLVSYFESARGALKPGGVLAFDISSAWKLEHGIGNGFFGEDRGDVAYLWSNAFDESRRTVTMDLTFFVRAEQGLYRRFDELHVQKAHDPQHLTELLEKSGFARVCVYADRCFDPPDRRSPRIHFSAIRE